MLRRSLSTTRAPAAARAVVEYIKIRDRADNDVLKPVRICRMEPPPSSPSTHAHIPPLILIGGTAQTIESWVGNVQQLATCGSQPRRVIMYETRGQGMTELSLSDATMPQHVEDFQRVVSELDTGGGGGGGIVDVCGFSFGGRLALAIAAKKPHLVRRTVLTGVCAERDTYGRLTFQAWMSALRGNNDNNKGGGGGGGCLEAMLWTSLLQSYSIGFLTRHEQSLAKWVENAVEANKSGDCKGVLAILEQTHVHDPNDEWHPIQLAQSIGGSGVDSKSSGNNRVMLVSGAEDRIAPAEQVERLAKIGGGQTQPWPCHIIPHAAHMVPIEQPLQWRRKVVEFLEG